MFKFGQKKWIEKSFDDVTVKEKLQWRVVVDVDAAVNVVSDVADVVVVSVVAGDVVSGAPDIVVIVSDVVFSVVADIVVIVSVVADIAVVTVVVVVSVFAYIVVVKIAV